MNVNTYNRYSAQSECLRVFMLYSRNQYGEFFYYMD